MIISLRTQLGWLLAQQLLANWGVGGGQETSSWQTNEPKGHGVASGTKPGQGPLVPVAGSPMQALTYSCNPDFRPCDNGGVTDGDSALPL